MKKVLLAASAVLMLSAGVASARVPAYGFIGVQQGGQTATGGPSGGASQATGG